jgi:hypothetical protein
MSGRTTIAGKTRKSETKKKFAFLINCRSLLENGFSILQRYVKEHMSFSGQTLWEVIADGLKVTLRFSIFHPLGALMFGNGDTIRFVVLFEVDSLE